MPLYPFKCLDCGEEFDKVFSMGKAPLKVECSCGCIAYRNWNAYGRTDELMKEHPRLSRALGCHPNQLKEMRKIHPGAEFVTINGMCQMKIKNRQDKLKRMKQRGMVEF